MTGDQLRGLVRAVEGGARHVYAVGERPKADLTGELGALTGEPGPGRAPVWPTRQGRLVTETTAPRQRPSPLAALRWVGEPAAWSGDGPLVRARAIASRALRSGRSLTSELLPDPPLGAAAGWLVPEGPETVALFEALHPVTGDQLLTNDPAEAAMLGYSEPRLLGHLVAAAPVTGVLGRRAMDLAWTRREPGHPPPSRGWGAVEQPAPGTAVSREVFFVRGLALFPDSPVSRVEVEVDGAPAGRARIGLPRAEHLLWQQSGSARAPVCGFEFAVTRRMLDRQASEVRVDAHAVGADGRRFLLPGDTFELEAPRQALGDPEGRVAGLRERTAELVAGARPEPHAGLKVLAFAHRLDLGGAQRYFFELLARLAEDPGFTATVVSPTEGPYVAAIEALGVPVHISAGIGPGDAEGYEGKLLELAAWAAPQGFDLVWANTVDAYPGADLAGRLGIPSVWSLHESFDLAHWWAAVYGAEGAHPYARLRAEESLRGAGALVFAADATRRQYESLATSERMHTLPYGMELDAIERYRDDVDPAAARERLGLPADATVVLCLGTVEPRKGQAVLAQAFAEIAARHPDAVLALVGDLGGEYSAGLHAFAERTGLGDRLRIESVATDPYAWHAAADVFALASDIESSPIVVLEAMAFGTPVVATAVFGVPELIEDGEDGYLCEASDVGSLAAALDRALTDPARAAVGAAGERRVRERHDPERYAERMQALMSGLVECELPTPRHGAPAVSVIIPTLNAGERFEAALESLLAQQGLGRLEILVADSGSADDTVALAERAGAEVQRIAAEDFNNGGVRNLLAARAGGDVLVATVQDAVLSEPTALRELAMRLDEDPVLAGVSALQVPGPGADLFSRWTGWLHAQPLQRGGTLDNVCAAIRPGAWEQLRFRELDFGEDLDFARRARAAGWGIAWSHRPLVAHHHDRAADHAFARAAVDRLQRPRFEDDLERRAAAAPGGDALLAALPTVLGRLQAAQDEAMPEDCVMAPARYLRRVSAGLRDNPGATEPRGELALVAGLCAGAGPTDGALPALADELRASLEFPWLLQFALAQPDPVTRQEADAFLSRFVGSALGEVVGDALRDTPESEPGRRLLGRALGGHVASWRG